MIEIIEMFLNSVNGTIFLLCWIIGCSFGTGYIIGKKRGMR